MFQELRHLLARIVPGQAVVEVPTRHVCHRDKVLSLEVVSQQRARFQRRVDFMRVLVTGAGIIGSIYGWALAETGHHVVHLVRSGRAAAFRDGLPLDVFDGRKGHKRNFRGLYRLHAVETVSPRDTFELVIVPVKHYALVQTLKEVVPKVGAAEFLLLTQNWRGTDDINPILLRTRYIYGDAKAGGTFSEGTLLAALKAIDLGSPEGEPSALARKFEGLFAWADIQTRLHSDMLHYLWIQYAITGGLWAALMQAGNIDAMLNDYEKDSPFVLDRRRRRFDPPLRPAGAGRQWRGPGRQLAEYLPPRKRRDPLDQPGELHRGKGPGHRHARFKRISSASISARGITGSKVTSICGMPRGTGGNPVK